MRVAFITAELAPYAQVGGLADVSRWLPATLAAGGDDVRVFLPRYDALDLHGAGEATLAEPGSLDLGPLGPAGVTELRGAGFTVYLIDAPGWFARGGVYAPGADEHLRFGALCRGVIEACGVLDWTPELVHANDWHTALFPLHADAAGGRWRAVPTVLTVHNLAYQGWFPIGDLERLGLDPGHPAIDERDRASGGVNSLRTGLRAADMVTTVSPTYAGEIRTPALGMGLDDTLRELGPRLVGILNGIGPGWDPARDDHLAVRYDIDGLADKAGNTIALRDRLGLAHRPGVPVLGIVSRMDVQKGFGLLRRLLPDLLEGRRAQVAAVGTGDPVLEGFFADLAGRFPTEAAYHCGFDTPLAHLIEAGADIFLMPSEFEPCGLNQMYAMAYGTVPVVHRTGGLADTVTAWDPVAQTGTGFLFDAYTPEALERSLGEALAVFADPHGWRILQRNGMGQDFSWGRRAEEYREVYLRAAG